MDCSQMSNYSFNPNFQPKRIHKTIILRLDIVVEQQDSKWLEK